MVRRSRRLTLGFRLERFGDDAAVGFLEQNFDLAFGFFELLLTFGRKRDTLFEKFHGVVERKLRAFQFADHLFEARQRALKIWLFGRFGFLGSRCVHVFFAGNSVRQPQEQ